MEKPEKLLILIVFFFILALSFLLLKLEKKEVQIPRYTTYLKDTMADANAILQTYGTSLYEIKSRPSPVNKNENEQLFMQAKIYSASTNSHPVLYYQCDSSLSVAIYDKYGYPGTENIKDNNLTTVLLKYQ